MKSLQAKNFSIFIFLSLSILLLDQLNFLNPIKSVAQTVFLPAQYTAHAINTGISDTFSFLTFWKSGELRIKNLEQRNLELISQTNKIKSLEKENIELKKQLGVTRFSNNKLLPVQVLGKSRYLIVSAGTSDGVRENMTVIYLDNLVGKVIKTNPKASFVELPTDASSKIPAKINTVRAVATGQFNSSIFLEKVAQNEEIKIDDVVLTTGENTDIYPNLIIGKITSIDSKETDIFKKATIKPIMDYAKLETVFIILE